MTEATLDYAVHPDWITLRVLTPELGQAQQVLDLVAQTLRDSFQVFPGPHVMREHSTTYDYMAISAKGIHAYWHNPGNGLKSLARMSAIRLEFGGKVLRAVNAVDLRDLLGLLSDNEQAVCTRFDIALDDFTKALWTWNDLHDAAEDGNYSGPSKRQMIYDFEGAVTYYFGTRKSEAFYRFYDKDVESGGDIPAHRMEVELKRSKAHQAFLAWLQPPTGDELAAANILAEFVMGNIDFLDRSSGDKNLDRCPRLPWWQAMKDKVAQGVKLAPIVAAPTIERTMTWLQYKVAPSIAMIQRVLSKAEFADWWDSVMEWGKGHQTHRHDRLVEAANLEGWGVA